MSDPVLMHYNLILEAGRTLRYPTLARVGKNADKVPLRSLAPYDNNKKNDDIIVIIISRWFSFLHA